MQAEPRGLERPLITILAAGDPLAGDVAACLSGRFDAEPVLSAEAARARIDSGTRGLIVMAGDGVPAAGLAALIRRALLRHCRVVVLGQGGLGLGDDLEHAIVRLPHLPSPQVLFESLADLGPVTRAGSA